MVTEAAVHACSSVASQAVVVAVVSSACGHAFAADDTSGTRLCLPQASASAAGASASASKN